MKERQKLRLTRWRDSLIQRYTLENPNALCLPLTILRWQDELPPGASCTPFPAGEATLEIRLYSLFKD